MKQRLVFVCVHSCIDGADVHGALAITLKLVPSLRTSSTIFTSVGRILLLAVLRETQLIVLVRVLLRDLAAVEIDRLLLLLQVLHVGGVLRRSRLSHDLLIDCL